LLATPLRDRFGIPLRLEFYTPGELQTVLNQVAGKMGLALHPDGAAEIAKRSRGTPRVAGRLLRRVRDFAAVQGDASVDRSVADAALQRLEVDQLGLDAMDRRYLRRIADHHAGGPVGVETLAAALAEARDTLEDVIEPYLIQEGLILRTSRGRMLGEPGWRHLGLRVPRSTAPLLDILGPED
jgi:Holliday junction DNA helicase RuvB